MRLCSHCLEFGSIVWLQHYFILNTVFEVLYSPRLKSLDIPQLAVLERDAEVHSGIGLGSGAVHITESD